MQPYQQANEEIKRRGEIPLKVAKTGAKIAASLGATAIGGLSLNKILPFLSNYIPQDLAIKGLSKIDPRFGKFFKKALSKGTSFEEAKDFIKKKILPEEKEEEIEEEGIADQELKRFQMGQRQQQQPQSQQFQQPQQHQQPQQNQAIDPGLLRIMQNMQSTMNKFRGQ